jgi:hypothetical protein
MFSSSPRDLDCWESKMAAVFPKYAVIRERIDRFSRNLTHTQAEGNSCSDVHREICIVSNLRWRPTAIIDFDRLLYSVDGSSNSYENSRTNQKLIALAKVIS